MTTEMTNTVNELTSKAISFLAEKNNVSEKYIAECIVSGQCDFLVSQINDLVKTALCELWETFNK